jgi:hypothetical protein
MSRKEAIRGLTVDLNVFEADSLQFSLLAKRRRDIGLENARGMLFQPISAEKSTFRDVQNQIDHPETVGWKKAQQGSGIVGTESQRPLRLENPMNPSEAKRSFRFGIDVVDAIEGKQDIVKAFLLEVKITGIHDPEIDAFDQVAGLLDHLGDKVDACNCMSHFLEEKARSPAAAADVQDPTRRLKMDLENPFFHGKKIKFAVLLQRLLTGKGFFVPQFLLGEIHLPRFPVLVAHGILQGFCRFLKEFFGTALRGAAKEIGRL